MWAALARSEDRKVFIDTITEEIEQDAGPELLPAYLQAAPPEQLFAGLERYWSKREEGDGDSAPARASTHAGRASRQGR